MKKDFKRLFSATTDEVTYKKEINTIVILLLIFVMPIIFTTLGLVIPYRIIRLFIAIIMVIDFYPCMIFAGIRIIHISDNRKKMKLYEGKKNYNFPIIKYSYNDILFWLDNAITPDTIYIVSCSNVHYRLEVSFESNGYNGPFINKKYIFNNEELVLLSDIENRITINHLIDKDGYIAIEAITENNNPILFKKVLQELNLFDNK